MGGISILIIIKGLIFAGALIFASYRDIKTRKIPDTVHIIIALAGFINFNPINSIAGLLLVPLPLLIIALKFEGVGGGDVKLMAACGFFLGLYGGLVASFIGFMMATIINLVYYKIKHIDKKTPFALAPYLSIGCLIAFLILR